MSLEDCPKKTEQGQILILRIITMSKKVQIFKVSKKKHKTLASPKGYCDITLELVNP